MRPGYWIGLAFMMLFISTFAGKAAWIFGLGGLLMGAWGGYALAEERKKLGSGTAS